jgi:hypothetical protein
MACSIVTTVGGALANSYVSIADADTYHETHLYADDWTNADSDTKCRALQMATRILDQQIAWVGVPAGSTQALLWPRVGAMGPNGYLIASDVIPTLVEQATAELARQLITADRTADNEVAHKGLSSITAGSISMTFSGGGTSSPLSDSVRAMVAPLGTFSGSGGAVTMRRG